MALRDVVVGTPPAVAEVVARVEESTATLTNRRGRSLLAGFTAAHFSHHVSNSLLNPLLPFIRDSFTLSYEQSGLLVSAFSVSLGLSNAPIGVLADRVGSRPVIVVGLVLTGAVSAALALAGAYWQLLLLLVLMGLIAGTYHSPAAALIARAFPKGVRAGTWRTPYLWLAFAPVVTGAIIWFLAPRAHERPPASLDRLAVFRDLREVVGLVGPLVSCSLLFQMVYAALIAFTSLYLVDARGISPTIAAAVFGVPQLVGVFCAPMAGHLSDRLGRRAVILIGMVGLGPALYSLVLVPNELILLPLLAIGLAASMRSTVTEVYVMDNAPAHRRATVLGSYYMLSQELGGLAAPFFGALAGVVGIAAAFSAATLGLAGLSVLVLLAHRRL